jgi:hypothetical protein
VDGNPLLVERLHVGAVGRGDPDRDRLVREYSYGIPTEEALDATVAASPSGIVEIGAGTGYWARLLSDRGADVIAYDLWPPPSRRNAYFAGAKTWFPVERGDEHVVARHAERTLLMVWPTWNEAWPGVAAAEFHAAGGQMIVYVGDGPGSVTGDSVLHTLLGEYGPCLACTFGVLDAPCLCGVDPSWQLVKRIALPHWSGSHDTCSLYERRTSTVRRSRRWRRRPDRLSPVAPPHGGQATPFQ